MTGTLLAEFIEREARMDAVYDGDVLRRTARAAGRRLGSGHLVLLSTSAQGAGVAAACAAERSEKTDWRQINLMIAPELPAGAKPVFIEVVDPGEGWQHFVLGRYPDAEFIFTDAAPALRVA